MGEIDFPLDNKGAGGVFEVEYGPTSAYGRIGYPQPEGPDGAPNNDYVQLSELEPATTYHYRARLKTPFGTADSGDLTVATVPLGGATLPVVANGTPTVLRHAATVPFTIDPQGKETRYHLLLSTSGPVGDRVVQIGPEGRIPAGFGPVGASVSVVDLEPGTTYHYVVRAEQTEAGGTEVRGPEGAFTTPAVPQALQPAFKKRFRLRRGQVRVGPITRRSKKLRVRVVRLPGKTKVKLKLIAGGAKQSARKKADAAARIRSSRSGPLEADPQGAAEEEADAR